MTKDEKKHESGDAVIPEGSIRVPLSKAIPFFKETRDALIFREPTAEDIEIAGNPVIIDADGRGDPKVTFDERKMNAMIARLSDVPLPFIRKMRGSDWNNCAWALAGFFVPGAQA